MDIDFLGDRMPDGYKPWSCHVCGAVCNFEAMTMCIKLRTGGMYQECGFDRDRPESNGGTFGFMVADHQ